MYKQLSTYPRYLISDAGEVFNMITCKSLSGRLDRDGYHIVGLRDRNGKYRLRPVHRLVALAYLDGYKPGYEVNHKNGDKTDNRSENLEWVTGEGNHRHAVENGLHPGRKPRPEVKYRRSRWCEKSKITEAQAEEIRRLYWDENYGAGKLGKMFGLNSKEVQRLVHYKAYKPTHPDFAQSPYV